MIKTKLSNDDIIILIDKYFFEINREQLKSLKFTKIAEYLSQRTGLNIPEDKIRRDKKISAHVKELKNQARNSIQSTSIVYVPLDVRQFLDKNRTTSSLKKVLIERDQYYKSICELALKISDEDRLLIKKVSELSESIKALKEENQNKIDLLDEANRNIIYLRKQFEKLKNILKNSVYPEIANELLREVNLIKDGERMIYTTSYPVIEDNDSMLNCIIKDEEKYSENNIIQGLFNKI
jgi:shikimate kinase